MRRMLRTSWNFLAILGVVSVFAGYAGALHPAGDSLAVFRVPLALGAALIVIWTDWRRSMRWPLAIGLMLVVCWHLLATRADPLPGSGTITLYQKNLLWNSGDKRGLLADISEVKADVVTLQEVSRRNMPVLDALKQSHPFQHYCEPGRVGSVAVLSRFPVVDGSQRCAERGGLAAMQIEGPKGPVWLVSIHLHWPWPYEQAEHVARLVPMLRDMAGPVLIGGDFNAVAWSHALAQIEKASGTTRVGHHAATFQLPKLGMWIGIDHVLTTHQGAAGIEARARLGSDHRGVVARLAEKGR